MTASTILEVENLSHAYHANTSAGQILNGLSFSVTEREFVCIVGPSGCGKTTLLRTLSGLLAPTGGEVRLDGAAVKGVPRGLALVFQDYRASLFPWKRVGGNVEYPLVGVIGRKERQARVAEALAAVNLAGYEHFYPWQLSGGMQQRVAIARSLAMQPRLLLMDEPFASVDAQTRTELEDLVLRLRDAFGMTILFVTHDVDESVYLGTRVLALSKTPTVKTADIPIALDFPRDQIQTRQCPMFVEIRSEVAQLIRQARPGGLDLAA